MLCNIALTTVRSRITTSLVTVTHDICKLIAKVCVIEIYCGKQMSMLSNNLFAKCLVLLHWELAILFFVI